MSGGAVVLVSVLLFVVFCAIGYTVFGCAVLLKNRLMENSMRDHDPQGNTNGNRNTSSQNNSDSHKSGAAHKGNTATAKVSYKDATKKPGAGKGTGLVIGELVGHRKWTAHSHGLLMSQNGEIWHPARYKQADQVPRRHNSHGIYSVKEINKGALTGYHGIEGEIFMWGEVIDATAGYRAEYARIKCLSDAQFHAVYCEGASPGPIGEKIMKVIDDIEEGKFELSVDDEFSCRIEGDWIAIGDRAIQINRLSMVSIQTMIKDTIFFNHVGDCVPANTGHGYYRLKSKIKQTNLAFYDGANTYCVPGKSIHDFMDLIARINSTRLTPISVSSAA